MLNVKLFYLIPRYNFSSLNFNQAIAQLYRTAYVLKEKKHVLALKDKKTSKSSGLVLLWKRVFFNWDIKSPYFMIWLLLEGAQSQTVSSLFEKLRVLCTVWESYRTIQKTTKLIRSRGCGEQKSKLQILTNRQTATRSPRRCLSRGHFQSHAYGTALAANSYLRQGASPDRGSPLGRSL